MHKRQLRENEEIEKRVKQRVRQHRTNSQQIDSLTISIEEDEKLNDVMSNFSNIFSFEFYRENRNSRKRTQSRINRSSSNLQLNEKQSSISQTFSSIVSFRANSSFRNNSSIRDSSLISVTNSLRQSVLTLSTSQLLQQQQQELEKQELRRLTAQVERAKLKAEHMKMKNAQMRVELKQVKSQNTA